MLSIQLQLYLDNMKDRKQQAVTLDVRKPIGHTGQFPHHQMLKILENIFRNPI